MFTIILILHYYQQPTPVFGYRHTQYITAQWKILNSPGPTPPPDGKEKGNLPKHRQGVNLTHFGMVRGLLYNIYLTHCGMVRGLFYIISYLYVISFTYLPLILYKLHIYIVPLNPTDGIVPTRESPLVVILRSPLLSGVEITDSSLPALSLLRALHAISRHWHTLYRAVCLPDQRPLIPNAEFINAKVCNKRVNPRSRCIPLSVRVKK